jgi:hypothetical protein
MICRYCETDIADKALICYRCGNPTTEPRIKPPAERSLFERPRRSRLPFVIVVILIVLALLAAGWLWGDRGDDGVPVRSKAPAVRSADPYNEEGARPRDRLRPATTEARHPAHPLSPEA